MPQCCRDHYENKLSVCQGKVFLSRPKAAQLDSVQPVFRQQPPVVETPQPTCWLAWYGFRALRRCALTFPTRRSHFSFCSYFAAREFKKIYCCQELFPIYDIQVIGGSVMCAFPPQSSFGISVLNCGPMMPLCRSLRVPHRPHWLAKLEFNLQSGSICPEPGRCRMDPYSEFFGPGWSSSFSLCRIPVPFATTVPVVFLKLYLPKLFFGKEKVKFRMLYQPLTNVVMPLGKVLVKFLVPSCPSLGSRCRRNCTRLLDGTGSVPIWLK